MWYTVHRSYPLQLQPGLHCRDQSKTGGQTEGTPGCLQERDDGEVLWWSMCRRTITPSTGRRHRCWTGPGDNFKEVLQLEQRAGGLEILGCRNSLMRRQEGIGRWSPTFDLQWHSMMCILSSVDIDLFTLIFSCDNWKILSWYQREFFYHLCRSQLRKKLQ